MEDAVLEDDDDGPELLAPDPSDDDEAPGIEEVDD